MPSSTHAGAVAVGAIGRDGLSPAVLPAPATGSVGNALVVAVLSVLLVTFGIYALFQLFVLADR